MTSEVRRHPSLQSLSSHWPEYAIEAGLLGAFLIAAGLFGILLEYPGSPLHQALPSPVVRRALFGVLMGLTAIAIIDSPLGMRSGAHINPAVTLMFFHLGKVKPWDALFYVLAQFVGAALGVLLLAAVVGDVFTEPPVHAVVTRPGMWGVGVAFLTEVAMTFVLMLVVLRSSNSERLARFTGVFVGMLVASYILLLAPVSGMSLNPARTFGSALGARSFTALWLYFLAPPLGMLLAAEVYRRGMKGEVRCAKLHHSRKVRCIFRCGYPGTPMG
ncbi:MAG: aquaporin [Myxococcaceae bacterium]|nr:aquaporin [Myxococcaceae bacterium]